MRETICVNSVLEASASSAASVGGEKRLLRVLAIEAEDGEAALIDVYGPNALPEWWALSELESALASGSMNVSERDPFPAGALLEEELTEADRRHRRERWAVIEPLLARHAAELLHPESRGPLLRDASRPGGPSKATLFKWLRQYWQRGQAPNALLTDFSRCGAPGRSKPAGERKRGRPSRLAIAEEGPTGCNVTEETRERIVQGGRLFYQRKVDGRALSWTDAHQKTLERFFFDRIEMKGGVAVPILKPRAELPTLVQFKYWTSKDIEERGRAEEVIEARTGKNRFPLENRSVTDSTEHLSGGPGDLFLIDATVGDLYLLSSLDPRYVIGRPVIYFVIDHWSRMIAGYYVGLEGPSWVGAMMALENAFTEKVSYCARHGYEIGEKDWPCAVYPREITADRGEMIGACSDALPLAFDIQVSNTPPFRADFKSLVETQFKITNERAIARQSGWVDKLRGRGEPDYRFEAALTLPDFHRVMIELIISNNLARRLTGDVPAAFPLPTSRPPVPLDLWNWGTRHYLGRGRTMSREQVRANLLPTTTARFTHQGLAVHGDLLHYDSAAAQGRGYMTRGAGKKSPTFTVSYDPRDVSTVYLHAERKDETAEVCRLTARDAARFAGKTLEEAQDYRASRLQAEQEDETFFQDAATLNARLDAIKQGAARRREEACADHGTAPSIEDMRTHRGNERRALQGEEAFTARGDSRPATESASGGGGDEESGFEYVPPPSE